MSAETDYAVPPGEFLRDWLEETSTTQQQLANNLGVSRKHVSALLSGATLSADIAAKLALVTGYSSRWWLRIESQYQADKARLAQEQQLADVADEISPYVAVFLRSEGFVHSTMEDPGALASEVCAFFGVATREALIRRLDVPDSTMSPGLIDNLDRQAESVWLRAGELKLRETWQDPPGFDVSRFRDIFDALQRASTVSSEEHRNQVSEKLTGAGVGVVIMQEISGWHVRGAIRCIQSRPVIQMTDQSSSDVETWLNLMRRVEQIIDHPHDEILR